MALDCFVVEQRRRGESCAAMNDPVSNRIDRVQVKPLQRVRYALQRVAGTGERRRAAFVRLAVPEAVFAASVLEAFVGTLNTSRVSSPALKTPNFRLELPAFRTSTSIPFPAAFRRVAF
jgi:hypothetical protein